MKLTQKAIEAIKTHNLYPHLAIALKVSVGSIYRYVATNDDNLTKAASLDVLKKETDLKVSELLETEAA